MNKTELIKTVAQKTGWTQKETEVVLEATLSSISETLAKGEKVQIVGFGGFEVHDRVARVARNPRTGEAIKVDASKAPVFKAGKALKDAVSLKK